MQLDPSPRLHITAVNPKETFESLVLDGFYYTRLCNGPWQRSPTTTSIGNFLQTWTVLSEMLTFTYDVPKTAFDPPASFSDETQAAPPRALH